MCSESRPLTTHIPIGGGSLLPELLAAHWCLRVRLGVVEAGSRGNDEGLTVGFRTLALAAATQRCRRVREVVLVRLCNLIALESPWWRRV